MRDLALRILELMGNPTAAAFGALPDRPTEIWRMYADATKARELLGWQPRTTLDEGLRSGEVVVSEYGSIRPLIRRGPFRQIPDPAGGAQDHEQRSAIHPAGGDARSAPRTSSASAST